MDKELDKTAIIPEETAPEATEMPMETAATSEETPTETTDTGGELEQLRQENQELKVFQNKVRDLAEADPQAAAFLHDLITTGSIGVALNENYDEEEIQALLEESKSTEYDEHRNNYSKKVGDRGVRMAELEANKAKSQMSAQEFVDKYQPEEEDLEKFIAFYDSIIKDAVDNNMSLDHWERLWKAYKYDGTVADLENKVGEAEENGKIAGRNEKIVQGKKSREEMTADLLPETTGGGTTQTQSKKLNYVESLNQMHDSTSPLKKLKV